MSPQTPYGGLLGALAPAIRTVVTEWPTNPPGGIVLASTPYQLDSRLASLPTDRILVFPGGSTRASYRQYAEQAGPPGRAAFALSRTIHPGLNCQEWRPLSLRQFDLSPERFRQANNLTANRLIGVQTDAPDILLDCFRIAAELPDSVLIIQTKLPDLDQLSEGYRVPYRRITITPEVMRVLDWVLAVDGFSPDGIEALRALACGVPVVGIDHHETARFAEQGIAAEAAWFEPYRDGSDTIAKWRVNPSKVANQIREAEQAGLHRDKVLAGIRFARQFDQAVAIKTLTELANQTTV